MIRDLEGRKYIRITTFRRTGLSVPTPVEFVQQNRTVYLRTAKDSGKVKRIRHNPSVTIAPCTIRGKPLGPAVEAFASLVDDDKGEPILQLFKDKYGILWRIGIRLRKAKSQYVKLTIASPPTVHLQEVKTWTK